MTVIMFKCLVSCIIVLFLTRNVYASVAEQMSATTQLCCDQGTSYARNHSSEDCSSSIPPDVPSHFGSLCLFAMDQCCKEYFVKKHDCDNGIDIASSSKQCSSAKDTAKVCCDECVKGTEAGASGGVSSCKITAKGKSAEEFISAEAYEQCCLRSAKEDKQAENHESTVIDRRSKKVDSNLPSVCEEYAPNELCAHHCIPIPGSYKCECNPGFKLMSDGRNCMEVVKNRCKPRNLCQHKCNDNGVEVKCSCRRGYELMKDGKSCRDIDECLLDPPVCLPNTQCLNIHGSYKCIPKKHEPKDNKEKGQCPPGFSKNIKFNACDDINECLLPNPPCPSYLCENTIGGYKCGGVSGDPVNLPSAAPTVAEDRCPPGFRMGTNQECEDVDECAIHKDDCNPLSQFCINTRGSFHCQDKASKHCPPGFHINPTTNKCEDINECEDGQDICRADQVCINVPGEYDCKLKEDVTRKSRTCPDGMRIKSGQCIDIDECVEGTHLCDQYQKCLNTNGSHECHCKLGFELDSITGACVDINECATNQHDCILSSQRCDNSVGSYLCVRITSCGTGYILQHTTSKCEDIDECALGLHNCDRAGPDFKCVNTQGSFRCVRKNKSTTTAAPEPEWEYYDEEFEDDNSTNTQNNKTQPAPTTTTTPQPTKPSEAPTTPKPAEPITIPIPTIPDNKDPDPVKPTERPDTPLQTFKEEEERYELKSNVVPEEAQPTKQNGLKYEIDKTPKIDSRTPEVAKQDNVPVDSVAQNPQIISVDKGEDTAIVVGQKTSDGSIVVNTQNVPKNQWTKVDVKPADCQIGFHMDELGRCFDIDECATNAHSCSGLTETCKNTVGGYLCDCTAGFRREFTSGICSYFVSTSSTTSTVAPPTTPPPVSNKNRDYFGYTNYRNHRRPFKSYMQCDEGYHLNSNTGRCEDLNECTNGQANCADHEICINTDGGYRCECPPNWRLDEVRQRCVPIRHTNQFPDGYSNVPEYPPENQEGIKHGTLGSRYEVPELTQVEDRGNVMRCRWGYRLTDDNSCEDIDECATGEAKCGPLQLCTNIAGGYSCSCPKGFKLIGDHDCEDVNECSLPGPICSQNADCINTIGSYQCRCHDGFRPAPVNNKVCVDVDECAESHQGGGVCQHRCNNVWGGYRCSCFKGYRLNADNRTCNDIDECTEFKSKAVCIGKCLNEPGSYKCTCPPGYSLSQDSRSCIDIDECELGEATCTGGDACYNTRGGYRCHRITCLKGYTLMDEHRCMKTQRHCPLNDWECTHQPSTYSYNFITFVSNLYIPDSKMDLFTMRGPTWKDAIMKFMLRLVNVNAPPSVKDKADINAFLLTQTGNQGVVSVVKSLVGPQSIELELSMELYHGDQFGGAAIAKLFIHVSEYEF